jgi:hypothetical protein
MNYSFLPGSEGKVQDKDRMSLLMARTVMNLQHAVALVQSESTHLAVMQLQQSLTQLVSIQRFLQLRVQWTPEQVQRQQERLARQQARLRWQQAMLEHLRDERGR